MSKENGEIQAHLTQREKLDLWLKEKAEKQKSKQPSQKRFIVGRARGFESQLLPLDTNTNGCHIKPQPPTKTAEKSKISQFASKSTGRGTTAPQPAPSRPAVKKANRKVFLKPKENPREFPLKPSDVRKSQPSRTSVKPLPTKPSLNTATKLKTGKDVANLGKSNDRETNKSIKPAVTRIRPSDVFEPTKVVKHTKRNVEQQKTRPHNNIKNALKQKTKPAVTSGSQQPRNKSNVLNALAVPVSVAAGKPRFSMSTAVQKKPKTCHSPTIRKPTMQRRSLSSAYRSSPRLKVKGRVSMPVMMTKNKQPKSKVKISTLFEVPTENSQKATSIRRRSFLVAFGNKNNSPAVEDGPLLKKKRDSNSDDSNNAQVLSKDNTVPVPQRVGLKVHFMSPLAVAHPPRKSTCTNRFGTPAKEPSNKENLSAWLRSRGHTPSNYRHMFCMGMHEERDCTIENVKHLKNSESSTDSRSEQESIILDDSLDSIEDNVFLLENTEPTKPMPTMPFMSPLLQKRRTWSDSPVLRSPLPVQYAIQNQQFQHLQSPMVRHDTLNDVLLEIEILHEAGCPAEVILPWLDELQELHLGAKCSASFWLSKVKVVDEIWSDEDILNIYEDAMRNNAKPAQEMADSLKDFLEKMNERKQALVSAAHTPGPKRHSLHMNQRNVFTSSAVKLSVAQPTPFFKRIRDNMKDINSPPCAIVTPVRRSTRKSCTSLPRMLQDHDIIIESLDELPSDMNKDKVLFQPNMALLQQFDEVA